MPVQTVVIFRDHHVSNVDSECCECDSVFSPHAQNLHAKQSFLYVTLLLFLFVCLFPLYRKCLFAAVDTLVCARSLVCRTASRPVESDFLPCV